MGGRDKFWGAFRSVSEKQAEFVANIWAYRREHNISQAEMARICNLYCEPNGIKFYPSEIGAYERLERTPHKPKYKALCNIMNLNPTTLQRRAYK